MNEHFIPSGRRGRRRAAGRILGEAAFVAVLGVAFAFAANQVSPRGLALTRDYFPVNAGRGISPAAAGTNAAPLSAAQLLAAQMKEKGLQLLGDREVLQAFRDPRARAGKIVFVDARDEADFQKGHIPGACELDPYRPEQHLGGVVPLCRQAEQIVVYCNGGDCDDSANAALLLRDIGIANQKIFIYGGGFAAWTTNRLPVATGARNSGSPRGSNP